MQDTGLETNVGMPLPHSKVGIAALAISLFGVLVFCIGAGIAFYAGFSGRGVVDQSSSNLQLATIIMCGSLFINIIGMALGIGSLFQPQQNKTFGVVGLVLSAIVLCIYGILTIVGLTMA